MKRFKGLEFPDAQTVETLKALAPENEQTMERIYQRSDAKFHAMHDAPAESETFQVEEVRPRRWLAAVVSLAACAVIGFGGWGLWKLQQHKPLQTQEGNAAPVSVTRIPFADALDTSIVRFNDGVNVGMTEVTDEQLAAFRDALETLSWEQTAVYAADNQNPLKLGGGYFVLYMDNGTPEINSIVFAREENRVLWENHEHEIREYPLTTEEFETLYSILFGERTAPFRDAVADALEKGRELQFYETPDEEGYPVLTQEQNDAFLAFLDAQSWMPYTGGVPEGSGCVQLVIPAENHEDTQMVWFYADRVGYSPALTADIVHYYAFSPGQLDALKAIIFGGETAALPAFMDSFSDAMAVAMQPAYAPYVFPVMLNHMQTLETAFRQSPWVEVDDTSWDGESTTLFVTEEHRVYSLQFTPVNTVVYRDEDGSHIYTVSPSVAQAVSKWTSYVDMHARNGGDPMDYLIWVEPSDDMLHSVWDAVDESIDESVLDDFREVCDRFNAEQGTDCHILTREECHAQGMTYAWYVRNLQRKTPEGYAALLEQDYSAIKGFETPHFGDVREQIVVSYGYDTPDTSPELSEVQLDALVEYIDGYDWEEIDEPTLMLPEDKSAVITDDHQRTLRLYWTDGAAMWQQGGEENGNVRWFRLPEELRTYVFGRID